MKSKLSLLSITFISGAMVMVFEIIGARILAPYIGTSFYVWTSLIGFILASLSIGYYWGGKWVDTQPKADLLAYSFLGAGISLLTVFYIKDNFLHWVIIHVRGIKASAFITSFILFVPASIFFGSISPMVAKLLLRNIETTGRTIGNVFTYSTIGSLTGTFLAGFYLLPNFALPSILIGLIVTSLTIALWSFLSLRKWIWSLISIILLFTLYLLSSNSKHQQSYIAEKESPYNSIKIFPTIDYQTHDSILMMQLGRQRAGAMSLSGRPLPFNYLYYFRMAEHFNPHFSSALMLGGAAYSFPKYFLRAYPSASIDVVEIDKELTKLAERYFHLNTHNPRLKIIHQDGRTFINTSNKKYDVIYSDTFRNAISLPYQLTTIEAIKEQYNLLNDGGLVMVNVIQAVEGKSSLFLQAEMKSFQMIFPQVYLFADAGPQKRTKIQSTIIVAIKSDKKPNFTSKDIGLDSLLAKRVVNFSFQQQALTDDFAPVDYLAYRGL